MREALGETGGSRDLARKVAREEIALVFALDTEAPIG